MTFESINSPEQLMQFLDENIAYGVIDKNGKKFFDSNSSEFQQVCNQQWQLFPVSKILKNKVGHCYDQVEIERLWFEKHGYKVKTFWISAYQEKIANSGFSHAYLIFKDGKFWKLFEHADSQNKGIFSFKTIKDAVLFQSKNQIKFAENCIPPQDRYVTCIKEYSTPPSNINMSEFLEFINASQDF